MLDAAANQIHVWIQISFVVFPKRRGNAFARFCKASLLLLLLYQQNGTTTDPLLCCSCFLLSENRPSSFLNLVIVVHKKQPACMFKEEKSSLIRIELVCSSYTTHHFVIINFANGPDHGIDVDEGRGIHALHTCSVTWIQPKWGASDYSVFFLNNSFSLFSVNDYFWWKVLLPNFFLVHGADFFIRVRNY